MDGAKWFRGEFFGVDTCLAAGIKGGEQRFREEKALGIGVFNVMALEQHHFPSLAASFFFFFQIAPNH